MGLSYFPLDSLPQQYDVVWCLYPESGLVPGPVVRPALVLDVRVNTKERVGALIVTYGTGVFNQTHLRHDLLILGREYEALGLHKPTRFALSLNSRMNLAWCSEYFVPQSYAKSQNIIAGALTDHQISRMLACLKDRGLEPY